MMKQFSNQFIILIVDGAPTHTAGLVEKFEQKNKKCLQIEILPAYFPELNPTEKCWRFLKTKKLDGSMAIAKDELRDKTKNHMREIKKDKERMSSFFDEL